MSKWKIFGIAIAVFAVAVSLLNASWLAPKPKGKLLLVAHRGLAQQFSREGVDNQTCTATRIRPPEHKFIENTVFSMQNAVRFGADAIELDVHPTSDGQMVVFHDWTLDCRTDGHGPVRQRTLAELKKLDVGYGYTADGGRTFPFRGKGIGAMPTVEEVLRELPRARIAFVFKSRDPRDADALVAAFRRAGVEIDDRFAFTGVEKVVARMRRLAPGAWAYDPRAGKACLTDYIKTGWTGIVPASCRDATVIVPLNYRWVLWGWPYRFLARMAGANSRVVIWGSYRNGGIAALDRPEQYDQVPADFHGWLYVDDFYAMGPALRR